MTYDHNVPKPCQPEQSHSVDSSMPLMSSEEVAHSLLDDIAESDGDMRDEVPDLGETSLVHGVGSARPARFRERPPRWWLPAISALRTTIFSESVRDPVQPSEGTSSPDDSEIATAPAPEELAVADRVVKRARFRDRPTNWVWQIRTYRQAARVDPRTRVSGGHVISSTAPAKTRQTTFPFAAEYGKGSMILAANRRATTLAAIVLVGAFLRLYHLDTLPGEIFGDMVENLAHIQSVLHGDLRLIYGFDGREALLYYLAAPLALLFGNTYLTLKLTVALIGIATIPAVYLLANEIFDENVATLSAFFIAVSKWPLIFSRVGFRAVLAPLFIALTFYFLVRAYKYERRKDFVLCGLFLGIGLYTYTGFRFAPVAVAGIFLVWLVTARSFVKRNLKNTGLMVAAALTTTLPMIIDFINEPTIYTSHSGSMLFLAGHFGQIRRDWLPVLLQNVVNQLLMFNVRGDIVFRVNVTNDPELDVISGLLFLVGVCLMLFRRLPHTIKDRWVFIVVPFIVLQLSSVLDLNFPIDIPSSTRVISIIPFVYILVAYGLWWCYRMSRRSVGEKALLGACLLYIALLNSDRYFNAYAYGLPDHNTPIGRIIARNIDRLPAQSRVAIVGCCWGEWAQPEPGGIMDALEHPRQIAFLDQRTYSCAQLRRLGGPLYVVFPPSMNPDMGRTTTCVGSREIRTHTSATGTVIFYSLAHGL